MDVYRRPDGTEARYTRYLEMSPTLRLELNSGDESGRAGYAIGGYALDFLVRDESALVRKTCAEAGFGLKELSRDKEPQVRAAVIAAGYNPMGFVDDEDEIVQIQLAKMGYALDKLLRSGSPEVRRECDRYLIASGMDFGEWLTVYPERVALDETKAGMIMQGIRLDFFKDWIEAEKPPQFNRLYREYLNRVNGDAPLAVLERRLDQNTDEETYARDVENFVQHCIDHHMAYKIVLSPHEAVWKRAIDQLYYLDVFYYHESAEIRSYCEEELDVNGISSIEEWTLDYPSRRSAPLSFDMSASLNGMVAYDDLPMDCRRCVDSPDAVLRASAAELGWGVDKLFSDPSAKVRAEVAWNGYRLLDLARDEDPEVRVAVAGMGAALDLLAYDPVKSVRDAARYSLAEENENLTAYIEAHPEACAHPEDGDIMPEWMAVTDDDRDRLDPDEIADRLTAQADWYAAHPEAPKPVHAEQELVEDHLPERLIITPEDVATLDAEDLASKMGAQDAWYVAHPDAARRDGINLGDAVQAEGKGKGK